MRLVCPSCRAEYEVDLALLPSDGREVQCSACQFIWFQAHPDHPAPDPQASGPAQAAGASDATPDDAAQGPVRPARHQHEPEKEDAAQSPRTVSGQALEILREEADFETRQRAREAEGLETQPELGLANPAPWPSKTQPDMRQKDTTAQDAKNPDNKAQSAQFPDIDDISTTLEPLGASRKGTSEWDLPETVAEKRRSFLKGLALPIGLAALVVGPYLLAPAIIDAVPATETALTGYVTLIDDLRVRLSGILGG